MGVCKYWDDFNDLFDIPAQRLLVKLNRSRFRYGTDNKLCDVTVMSSICNGFYITMPQLCGEYTAKPEKRYYEAPEIVKISDSLGEWEINKHKLEK